MSIMIQADYWCGSPGPERERVMVYSGVREAVNTLWQISSPGHLFPYVPVLVFFDIPLCIVMDTVLLPLTIYESIAGPRSSVPTTETAP